MPNNKAVLLLSGGLDSSTVLALLAQQQREIYALSFNYAQNHLIELAKITEFIKDYQIAEHRVIELDLSAFTNTALVGSNKIQVPKYQQPEQIGTQIPVTYVPARNTIFLSYALGYAETIGASDIYIGAHVSDSANYPDCRPEYLASYQQMANLATKQAIEGNKFNIHAPLIKLTKADIVQQGLALGIDYAKTISCYDPTHQGSSCGQCHACLVRLEAFKMNNINDPATYV